MKYDAIRLVGAYTTVMPLNKSARDAPFVLRGADGLGPASVSVKINQTVGLGSVYGGSSPGNMKPVFRIGLATHLAGQMSAEQLRSELYGLLHPQSGGPVRVEFLLGHTTVAYLEGYTEMIDISTFVKDPEVQVTIAGITANLISPNEVYVAPSDRKRMTINNPGTAPVAFRFEVKFDQYTPDFQIIRRKYNADLFRVNYAFHKDDILTFDTRPGFKNATLNRDGYKKGLLKYISEDSVWMTLHIGENFIETSTDLFTWGGIWFTPEYVGV